MKQVLYREYRPKTFDEIYGQGNITAILKNQIKNNSISHAYLFCGPRGTGKTSTARIFAKELNNGSEIDIIELDAASHNKVEDIREIIDKLNLAPFESKYKIYILDEVHMLSQTAFNAFLKSLEEPPPHVIFILATTEPHKLPQTILSRTQRFDFNRISDDEIFKRLAEILNRENITFDKEAISLIARKSDGGLRDAIGMLDKAISYGKINIENVSKALGSFSDDIYIKILKAILTNNTPEALILLNIIDESGVDPKVFISDFIKNIKDAILIQNKIDIQNETAYQMSKEGCDSNFAFIIEEMGKTLNSLRYSPSPKVEFIASIVSLCNVKFENIALYKNIPSNLKKEFLKQNELLNRLEHKIAELEEKLKKLSSYPQNSVDNPDYNVDNSQNNRNLNTNKIDELSTEKKGDEIFHSNVTQTETNQSELINIEKQSTEISADIVSKVENMMPQIKQKMREKFKISLFSVFEMSRPLKYENGKLFFIFEDENRNMIDIMKKSEPAEFLDPILSELLGTAITSEYITDLDIKTNTDKEIVKSIENKIKKAFADIDFKIKE